MRLSAFLRLLLFAIALASSALLSAQFQASTDEELKMTADPKAPGAAAVYLNIEEVTDDQQNFQSIYARIKILKEQGKDLATVVIPYDHSYYRVETIQARAIHPDGTVIPLSAEPADQLTPWALDPLLPRSWDEELRRKVFTVPNVEIGTIIEYRYLIRNLYGWASMPLWQIQRPYFVHKAHYAFLPFRQFGPGRASADTVKLDRRGNPYLTLLWWPILPPGVEINTDVLGRRTVDVVDVPPAPSGEWMPPMSSVTYKVQYYYMTDLDPKNFWAYETGHWSKDVDHFVEPSNALRQVVAGIVAPGDSDLDKARKLYKAVQALENVDFSPRKEEVLLKRSKLKTVRHAEDTWTEKSGSSEEIALLYLALLRSAGLTANAMKVVDRDKAEFNASYLSLDQFNDIIVMLSVSGKEIALDPGEKMCPFQTLHWTHAGAVGIRQGADVRTTSVSPLPAYTDNKLDRVADISLDARGAVTGSLHFTFTGQEALLWRQRALTNSLDLVKKQFDQWIVTIVPDGVHAHIDNFQGLDDPDASLAAVIEIQGALPSTDPARISLPAFLFEARANSPFVSQEKRIEPVDMHFAEIVSDRVVYHLPSGMRLEATPQDSKTAWAGHAVFGTKAVPAQGQITMARALARAFTTATPEEYQDLRNFYLKVDAADQQQLVLTTSPPAKGN